MVVEAGLLWVSVSRVALWVVAAVAVEAWLLFALPLEEVAMTKTQRLPKRLPQMLFQLVLSFWPCAFCEMFPKVFAAFPSL